MASGLPPANRFCCHHCRFFFDHAEPHYNCVINRSIYNMQSLKLQMHCLQIEATSSSIHTWNPPPNPSLRLGNSGGADPDEITGFDPFFIRALIACNATILNQFSLVSFLFLRLIYMSKLSFTLPASRCWPYMTIPSVFPIYHPPPFSSPQAMVLSYVSFSSPLVSLWPSLVLRARSPSQSAVDRPL